MRKSLPESTSRGSGSRAVSGRGAASRRLRHLLLSIPFAAGLGQSCSPGKPDAAPPVRPNVVLVLVDTLRADHLGSYGYQRATSRHLDEFAADAVLFEQNRSQGTCTFPSANSILTGRYVQRFTQQEPGHLGIPASIRTAAEILRDLGYSTFAVSASPIVRRTPSSVNLVGGFDAGFASFDEGCLDRDAACVTDRARSILSAAPSPFFLFLHYMDPHAPYQAPPSEAPRFAGPYDGEAFIRSGDPQPIAAVMRAGGRPTVSDRDIAHLRDLYDEEIAYFDVFFAQLLHALEAIGHYDDTVVVLLSDHGEQFLDHDRVVHCDQPFDTLVRTPLVIRSPGGRRGARITTPVGNIDVLPTIVSYASPDRPLDYLEGRSLRALLEGGERSKGLVYSSHAIWRSVFDGRYKLIWNVEKDSLSLFDLEQDPGEKQPATDSSEARRRLETRLRTWVDSVEGDSVEQKVDSAQRLERHLRATGYLK